MASRLRTDNFAIICQYLLVFCCLTASVFHFESLAMPVGRHYNGATGLIYEEPECLALGGICRYDFYCAHESDKLKGLCPRSPDVVQCCVPRQEPECEQLGGECKFELACLGGLALMHTHQCPRQHSDVMCCLSPEKFAASGYSWDHVSPFTLRYMNATMHIRNEHSFFTDVFSVGNFLALGGLICIWLAMVSVLVFAVLRYQKRHVKQPTKLNSAEVELGDKVRPNPSQAGAVDKRSMGRPTPNQVGLVDQRSMGRPNPSQAGPVDQHGYAWHNAHIYMGKYSRSVVAIKVHKSKYHSVAKQEALFLVQLHHPNIVRLVGTYEADPPTDSRTLGHLRIVTEWMPGGDLETYLYEETRTRDGSLRFNIVLVRFEGLAADCHFRSQDYDTYASVVGASESVAGAALLLGTDL